MVTGGVILAVVVIGGLAGWIEQEMGLPVRMDIRFDSFLCVGILLLVPGIVSLYSLWKYRKLQPAMAVKTSGVSKSQNSSFIRDTVCDDADHADCFFLFYQAIGFYVE